MICPACSAHLPDESRFCPYCMTRFDNEGSKERKSKKSKEAIFAALLISVTLIVAAVIAVFIKKAGGKEPPPSGQEEIYIQEQEQQSETTAPSTESETVTVEINGDYYTPGTYFWSINGNGKVVLEDYEYYPF